MNFKNFFIFSLVTEQIVFLYLDLQFISMLGARVLQLLAISYVLFLRPQYLNINFTKIDLVSFLFSIFIVFGFIVGLINLQLGQYANSFYQNVNNGSTYQTALSRLVRETVVYIYFFFIFVFLFNRIINSRESLLRFFLIFRRVFIFLLVIGYFLFFFYYLYGYNLLPRQLNYGFDSQVEVDVGLRFMSLFGEPRDAVACLMIGLGILALEQIYLINIKKIKKIPRSFWLTFFSALIAFYLTNSGSGLIAVALFLILVSISVLSVVKLNARSIFIISLGIAYLLIILSASRTTIYFEEIQKIPDYMSGYNKDNLVLQTQFNNILPIWLYINYFIELKIIPIFFGNGFASSAFVSYAHLGNFYSQGYENPHSQISRLVFETGIVGTFIWYLIFIIPINRFKKIIKRKEYIIISMIYIFSFSSLLAHRNPEMFLLLGVTLATFNQRNKS